MILEIKMGEKQSPHAIEVTFQHGETVSKQTYVGVVSVEEN